VFYLVWRDVKIRYIDVMNGMMCGYNNVYSPYCTVNDLEHSRTDQQVRIALNKSFMNSKPVSQLAILQQYNYVRGINR
jgi:hypothetical protein